MIPVVRALASGLLGGLLSAAWLAAFFLAGAAVRTEFSVNPPRLLSGVYGVERDPATGLTFAWTGPELA